MTGTAAACVEVLWIPVGAGPGTGLVRISSQLWERWQARRAHRPAVALYHAALMVGTGARTWAVEMGPAWDPALRHLPPERHGVVATGPVGSRVLGRIRWFRYELRRRPDGVIPDADHAAGRDTVPTSDERAARLLELCPRVPPLVWGRDERGLGEMWNSNSIVAWLLVRSGHDLEGVGPPPPGRAPGWAAGSALALSGS